MSVVAFILTVSFAHLVGRRISGILKIDSDDVLRGFLISAVLGLMALSGLAFLLLAAGIGSRIVLAGLVYAGGIAGIVYGRREFAALYADIRSSVYTSGNPLRALFGWMLLFFLLLTFYLTLAPSTAWDGLTYHYPLPSQWLDAGSFVDIPEIIYSNFPSSAELVFIYGFASHSDIAANHLSWFAGFLCVLYLVHFGRKYLSIEAGLGASIIFLSYPVVFVEELQGGYIDLFQMLYVLAMLDAVIEWASSGSFRQILAASLFSGFLLCIKHTGLLSFGFFFFCIAYLGIRKLYPAGRVAVSLLLFILLTFLLPIGWYIKSYMYTGNPVYPFLYHHFGGSLSVPPDIMYWANPSIKLTPILVLLYPIYATFDVSMVQLKFRLLPPSLLAMLPFLFFRFRRTTFGDVTLYYSVAFVLITAILEPGEPRYNLASWALLGLIALDSAFRFSVNIKWLGKIVIPILILIPLAVGSVDISRRMLNYRHKSIWLNQPVREYYLGGEKHEPLDCYPMLDEINQLSSKDDVKVLLAEPRVFLLNENVDYTIAYPFQTENMWDWDTINYIEIPFALKKGGYTHIAITYGPNYRGICEAWFIVNRKESIETDNRFAHYPSETLGTGSSFFMRLAGYANPHLKLETKLGWEETLEYDLRFKNMDDLFLAEGSVDVKLPAAVMWLSQNGYIKKIHSDNAGAIFEVVQ